MESKIKIRLGPIEVEYEGSESFLKGELPDLIRTISDLYRTANLNNRDEDNAGNGDENGVNNSPLKLSTNSIAAKLRVTSGPELAVAAAAHLTFVRGSEVFSRQNLLKEMQNASSYYKGNYAKNLTSTINRLLKTKFNQSSSGNFALTADAKEELRAKLA